MKKSIYEMNLNELLKECDKLWDYDIAVAFTYNYSLSKFPAGWQFNVINSWQKWLEKGLTYNFGVYREPEHAVRAFLMYVEREKISVKKLADRTPLKQYDELFKKHGVR